MAIDVRIAGGQLLRVFELGAKLLAVHIGELLQCKFLSREVLLQKSEIDSAARPESKRQKLARTQLLIIRFCEYCGY